MKIAALLTGLIIFSGLAAQVDEWMAEGDKAFSKGNYKESIAFYDKVIKEDPEKINAFIQRGLAFSITKDYDRAIIDFTYVIGQHPELTAVRNSRGSAYMKFKEYDKAIADFNAVIELDPENQEAYNNRGWCKKHKGDKEGACADWKKSKKLGNKDARLIMKNNGC